MKKYIITSVLVLLMLFAPVRMFANGVIPSYHIDFSEEQGYELGDIRNHEDWSGGTAHFLISANQFAGSTGWHVYTTNSSNQQADWQGEDFSSDTAGLSGIVELRLGYIANSTNNKYIGINSITGEFVKSFGIYRYTSNAPGNAYSALGYSGRQFSCSELGHGETSIGTMPAGINWTYQDPLGIPDNVWHEYKLTFDLDLNYFTIMYREYGEEDWYDFSAENDKCFWDVANQADYETFGVLHEIYGRYPVAIDFISLGEPGSGEVDCSSKDNYYSCIIAGCCWASFEGVCYDCSDPDPGLIFTYDNVGVKDTRLIGIIPDYVEDEVDMYFSTNFYGWCPYLDEDCPGHLEVEERELLVWNQLTGEYDTLDLRDDPYNVFIGERFTRVNEVITVDLDLLNQGAGDAGKNILMMKYTILQDQPCSWGSEEVEGGCVYYSRSLKSMDYMDVYWDGSELSYHEEDFGYDLPSWVQSGVDMISDWISGVVNTIKQSFPFSWFFGISDIYNQVKSEVNKDLSYPSLMISVAGFEEGVDMFPIASLVEDENINSFFPLARSILTMIIAVSFVFVVFHRVKAFIRRVSLAKA